MHLVRGEFDRAGGYYRRAAQLAERVAGDLAVNRSAAELLLAEWKKSAVMDLLETWFPQPLQLVFSGHLPDTESRTSVRLPESLCRPDGPIASFLRNRLG